MKRIAISFVTALLIVAMSLTFGQRIWAQSALSEIHGEVTDPTGAAIVGATVTLTKTDTGVDTTLASNQAGLYYGRGLKPGLYEIRVEFIGFKVYHVTGVDLRTAANLNYAIMLEVGDVTETIEVTAAAGIADIQTASGDVSSLITPMAYTEMPSFSRRAYEHIALTPGVTMENKGLQVSLYIPFFSVAGSPGTRSHTYIVDGTDVVWPRGTQDTGNMANFNPPVEITQEMRVLNNNYSAEFGQSIGAVLVTTTKSGTNDIHGQAFYYGQNDVLDARDFFSVTKPVNKFHNYGGYIGGPIVKNKTHVLVHIERETTKREGVVFQNLPTALQKQGDFSQKFDAGGNVVPIYDPATTVVSADGTTATRTQFENNTIPTGRFDPVAAQVVPMYPAPNRAGLITGARNFNSNWNPLNLLKWSQFYRLDHQFTDNHRLYIRTTRDLFDGPQIGPWTGTGSELVDAITEIIVQPSYTTGVAHDWIISPTTLSRVGFSYVGINFLRAAGRGRPDVFEQDWAGRLGLKNLSKQFFPSFQPADYQTIGSGTWFQDLGYIVNRSYGVDNTITMMRGKHTLKAGSKFKNAKTGLWARNWPSGMSNYNTLATGQPGIAGTGDSIASFLLGEVAGAAIFDPSPPMNTSWYLAGFFQDDWRVSPDLTLNLGVRYAFDRPKLDLALTKNYLIFDKNNPACDCPGALEFARNRFRELGKHTTDYEAIWNNIAPRLGFAWKIGGRQDLVLRGGFGMFYTEPDYADNLFRPPNSGTGVFGDWATPDNGITPAFRLSQGFLPPIEETLNASWGAVAIGENPRLNPQFYWEDRKSGYSQQYNVGVQKQFGKYLLETLFMGNRVRRYPLKGYAYNELRPEDRTSQLLNRQGLRPFPQYGNVIGYGESLGISDYYAGTIQVKRQFSQGLQFQTHYTYASHDDNFSFVRSRFDLPGKATYGPSPWRRRHRFVWSSVYELPWGPGRRWLSSGALGNVVGGWTTGLLLESRSGQPRSFGNLTNTCNCFSWGTQGVDVTGSPGEGPSSFDPARDKWFNTEAFSAPAENTFGNAGGGIIDSPGFWTVDLSIGKAINVTERFTLQFRGEFLNLLNNTNFGFPNTTFGAGDFGVISSTAPTLGHGRRGQLGMKLLF